MSPKPGTANIKNIFLYLLCCDLLLVLHVVFETWRQGGTQLSFVFSLLGSFLLGESITLYPVSSW